MFWNEVELKVFIIILYSAVVSMFAIVPLVDEQYVLHADHVLDGVKENI